MKFTGYYDKDGNKLYEGDFINYRQHKNIGPIYFSEYMGEYICPLQGYFPFRAKQEDIERIKKV